MTTISERTETATGAHNLPDGWQIVRFDQMAESITDRVDNPSEAGVEYYIGLEHLDSDSLKIRRWGAPTDVEATKLRFLPGDIIFGRRRAYQRKVAVADFEGICSAHALVLRAREDVVLPEFLPFFMQSETFFQRALSISVGSLSPTINWTTLAQQEFALPPIDEQRRIAEILWAAEEAIEAWKAAETTHTILKRALLHHAFDTQPDRSTVSLGEVGVWLSGGTPTRSNPNFWQGTIPWASPKDMKSSILSATEEYVTEAGAEAGSKIAPPNTIFIVVRGMILAHTAPVALIDCPMAFNQDMKALVASERFRPLYLLYWFQSKAQDMLRLVSDSSHGTKRIETEALFSLQVPELSLSKQDEIVTILRQADIALDRLGQQRAAVIQSKSALLRNLLQQMRVG